MAPKIEINGLDKTLAEHALEKLGDQSLPDDDLLAAKGSLKQSYSPTADADKKAKKDEKKVELTLLADARAGIRVFNNEGDTDPDGVLASESTRKKARERKVSKALDVPPQLELTKGDAWVKYDFDAQLKGKGGVDVNSGSLGFAFDLSGDRRLRLADYRAHDSDDVLLETIATDLGDPRSVFLWSDVEALGVGDALAMRVNGTLSAGLKISWSDVFSSQIGLLAKELPEASVLGIELEAGASISATAKLTDDFRLVVSRPSAGRYRVAVKKAQSTAVSASLKASLDVQFDKDAQDAIKKLADKLAKSTTLAIDGLLKDADLGNILNTAALEKIVEKATDKKLGEEEKALVEKVLKGLGLDAGKLPLAKLKEAVQAKRDEIAKRAEEIADQIKKAAKAKLELSFAYEYSRTATDESLLQATLPGARLETLHGDLIRGRLDALLAAARQNDSSIEIETFLRKKTVETKHAYGFTLGIGDWSVFGKDVDSRSFTEETNARGEIRRAYAGMHTYKGKWINEDFEWSVDLDFSTDEFTPPPLKFDALDVKLHTLWRMERPNLSAGRLREYLDTAIAWKVFDQSERDRVLRELDGARGLKTELLLQLTVGESELRKILTALAGHTRKDLGAAMGTAMPYRDTHGRERPSTRRRLYAPIWRGVLEAENPSPKGAAHATAKYLGERDYKDLAHYESEWSGANRPFTVGGLVDLNEGSLRRDLESFISGIHRLHRALGNDSDSSVVPKILDEVTRGWTQSHFARAQGVYWTDAAWQLGILGAIERTMKVTYGDMERVYTGRIQAGGTP